MNAGGTSGWTGSRLFLAHPWIGGALLGALVALGNVGFGAEPAMTAASGVGVGLVWALTWRGAEPSSNRLKSTARRRWWAVPAAALFLAAAVGGERQSDRVIVEALGASTRGTVTYGTAGDVTTLDVDIPWSQELKGLHHGDVVTVVVKNGESDDHVICRIVLGGAPVVADSAEGPFAVARCTMTFG